METSMSRKAIAAGAWRKKRVLHVLDRAQKFFSEHASILEKVALVLNKPHDADAYKEKAQREWGYVENDVCAIEALREHYTELSALESAITEALGVCVQLFAMADILSMRTLRLKLETTEQGLSEQRAQVLADLVSTSALIATVTLMEFVEPSQTECEDILRFRDSLDEEERDGAQETAASVRERIDMLRSHFAFAHSAPLTGQFLRSFAEHQSQRLALLAEQVAHIGEYLQ